MNTTKLNKTTKKAERWIKEYKNSFNYSVRDFYKSCSYDKMQAEKDIINKMNDNKCYGYKILNGNTFYFTCGYKSEDGKTLYIETSCNTFEIAL